MTLSGCIVALTGSVPFASSNGRFRSKPKSPPAAVPRSSSSIRRQVLAQDDLLLKLRAPQVSLVAALAVERVALRGLEVLDQVRRHPLDRPLLVARVAEDLGRALAVHEVA